MYKVQLKSTGFMPQWQNTSTEPKETKALVWSELYYVTKVQNFVQYL